MYVILLVNTFCVIELSYLLLNPLKLKDLTIKNSKFKSMMTVPSLTI